MKHNSIEALIADWVERAEVYRKESEDFFKTGYSEESGIQFGRQGATRLCAEELLQFIDYLQKQVHAVGIGLLSFEERYPLNNLPQHDDQNVKNTPGRKVGQNQEDLSSTIREG